MWTIFKIFLEFVTILLLWFMFWFFSCKVCGILISDQGLNRYPLLWKAKTITGPPGKSPHPAFVGPVLMRQLLVNCSWAVELGECCCCCVASVVSDSVRPHRRQPIRLLCPWDSLGKSTGVGEWNTEQMKNPACKQNLRNALGTLRSNGLCSSIQGWHANFWCHYWTNSHKMVSWCWEGSNRIDLSFVNPPQHTSVSQPAL